MSDIGSRMSDIGTRMLDIGTWMLDIGPDVGYRYPDVRYHIRCPISILEVVYDIIASVSFCLKRCPIHYNQIVTLLCLLTMLHQFPVT